MEHMVGKGMSMTVQWHQICVFLFKTFKTEQIGTFLVGCLFSFIIAGLTVALPALKQKFMPDVANHQALLQISGKTRNSTPARKIKLMVYYLVYSLVHMINMLIIMTMNIWVMMFILAGVGLSFYFFCSHKLCCH